MILVIDNYDSFTFNLVHYLIELGAEVRVVRNDDLTAAEALATGAEAMLISPGPCTPAQAGVSLPAIREFAGKIPLLGVCLGHQAIGEAFGGRDHTTELHACRTIAELRLGDTQLNHDLHVLTQVLRG